MRAALLCRESRLIDVSPPLVAALSSPARVRLIIAPSGKRRAWVQGEARPPPAGGGTLRDNSARSRKAAEAEAVAADRRQNGEERGKRRSGEERRKPRARHNTKRATRKRRTSRKARKRCVPLCPPRMPQYNWREPRASRRAAVARSEATGAARQRGKRGKRGSTRGKKGEKPPANEAEQRSEPPTHKS